MKKIISLLLVGAVGLIGFKVYSDVKLTTEDTRYYRTETIQIDSPFEKDKVTDQLLKEIQNLDQRNYGEEFTGRIYADRTGGTLSINVSGSDLPKYQEHIKNIEKVLEVEGIVDFIYDEEAHGLEKEMLQTLEPWGVMMRTKSFGDVIVSTERHNNVSAYKQYTNFTIMRDKLKKAEDQALVDRFKTEKYFLKDFITGGQQEMIVLANQAEIEGTNRNQLLLDEQGNALENRPVQIRYELLVNEGNVQEMRVVAQAAGEMVFAAEDFEMLQHVATQLGVDAAKVEALVKEILKQPKKSQKDQIGSWQYEAISKQEKYVENETRSYLSITLK